MLWLEGNVKIQYTHMGQFIGNDNWIHPEISVPTYEIIFVNAGEVFIEEDGSLYHLTEGDMICLRPNTLHRGYRKTNGTGFYWLHFHAENYDKIGVYHHKFADVNPVSVFFKQLGHLASSGVNQTLIECKLAAFLLETKQDTTLKNKLFSDACEYIRRNIASAPTVTDVADKFRYNPDYMSRIFTQNCGLSIKSYIDECRNDYIKHLLLNTTMSIKEIASVTAFGNNNALTKFFKYNNGCTPTAFRNTYYASYTNNY